MQEVEGAALAGEQGARVGGNLADNLAGGDRIAVLCQPAEARARVEMLQTGIEPGGAAQHGVLSAGDHPDGGAIGRCQSGGEVAAADVLGECGEDVAFDFLGERMRCFHADDSIRWLGRRCVKARAMLLAAMIAMPASVVASGQWS